MSARPVFHFEVEHMADSAQVLATCDEVPGLVGHGEDEDEAVEDLVEQLMFRVLH